MEMRGFVSPLLYVEAGAYSLYLTNVRKGEMDTFFLWWEKQEKKNH